jgi:hypothetical protein
MQNFGSAPGRNPFLSNSTSVTNPYGSPY